MVQATPKKFILIVAGNDINKAQFDPQTLIDRIQLTTIPRPRSIPVKPAMGAAKYLEY